MNVGGGLRPTRAPAAALALLLLIPAIIVLVPSPAEAQRSSDPWWGPSARDRPTDGWAIRVPIVIENNRSFPLVGAYVSVDLDFNAIMLAGGWISQTVGTEERLRGFTLDVDSIRVVEYAPGFAGGPLRGPDTEPVPHVFYPAMWRGERQRDFDAARNPVGTVLFHLADPVFAGAKRYFYLYANPLEYGKHAPPAFTPEQRAPLEAYLWGTGLGTVFYGYELPQPGLNHLLQIFAPGGQATVSFYRYNVGKFVPLVSTPGAPNPLKTQPDGSAMYLMPANTAYKIVSDQPILVVSHRFDQTGSPEVFSYIPAITGGFAGTNFRVFGARTISGPMQITLIKASPGSVHVTAGGSSVTLSESVPVQTVQIPGGAWSAVTVSDPSKRVLVSMALAQPPGDPVHTISVPSLTGGPIGTEFVATIPPSGGTFRLCPEGRPAHVRITQVNNPLRQVLPEGSVESVPPNVFEPSIGCATHTTDFNWPNALLRYYSVIGDGLPPTPFRFITGAPERVTAANNRGPIGHWPGVGGLDHIAERDFGIFGHFNDTRVTILEERTRGVVVNRTISVSEDQFFQIQPKDPASDSLRRYRVISNKPISVVPTGESPPTYAYPVPGRPMPPLVTVGQAEFRGPLVELRSTETTARQLPRATGPGSPVTFPLEVVNFGRWIAGADLPDRIRVTCNVPQGWTVDGCAREVSLASRTAERLQVVVTPAVEDVNSTRTILVEARSATGEVISTLRLIVYVEVRYGVGMWFDVEGGRKTIDPPIGLNPADTHRYTVILKNTGSAGDRFDLTVDDPRPGWTQVLELDGAPVRSVTLAGGETAALRFRVTAPNAETAQQNIVSIKAQSVSSALAADIVNTATRIRPKIDVKVSIDPPTHVAAPNETAVFNISIQNSGNDIFRILLRQDGVLPLGWNASLDVSEIDLGPGQPFHVPLRMTPPLGSRAGDLATAKITAEIDTGEGAGRVRGDEVSAVVVVRKIHNVTTPDVVETRVRPGDVLRYVLPLANSGNGHEAIEMLPGSARPTWRVVADASSLFLEPGGTGELELMVTVPNGAPAGPMNLTFGVRLSREAFQNLTIPIEVLPTLRLAFEGAREAAIIPGQPRRIDLDVENVGNLGGTFDFALEAAQGWTATFDPPRAVLQPGARLNIRAHVESPRDAPNGPHAFSLVARAGADEAGALRVAATVARPDLFLDGLKAAQRPRVGDLLLVEAGVGNRGGIAAENVTVALVVDGVVVDTVILGRVPVDESKLATLSWLATTRAGEVRVIIDPDGEMVDANRDQNDAVVVFGSRLLIPAPWPLALAGLAAAAFLLTRRRTA